MRMKAIEHLFDVTPAVIAGWMLGGTVPDEWRRLSLLENLEWNGKLRLRHPISAEPLGLDELKAFLSGGDAEQVLKELREAELKLKEEALRDGEGAREIWDELPKRLYRSYLNVLKKVNGINAERLARELVHIPADPAFPDHDWLSRAEIYASIKAIGESGERVYLLRFKISPVQGFIGNARKELDFWAGSHLLSTLAYRAIETIVEREWPGAVIFPHLRGQPFFVHSYGGKVKRDDYIIPNMPNKVLAIVGLKSYEDLAGLEREIKKAVLGRIEELFREAWEYFEMDDLVGAIAGEMGLSASGAFDRYLSFALGYFRMTVEAIPYEKLPVKDRWSADIIKRTHGDREAYYPYLFAVLDQKTEFKSARFEKPIVDPGFKCTLCGELPSIGNYLDGQVIPRNVLRRAWKGHVKKLRAKGKTEIRENERLCPLCLVKRYYPRTVEGEFGSKHWVSSVSEVALRGTEWERILDAARNGVTYGTGKVAKLVEKLSDVFELLGFNSELVYPEGWMSVKSLAKVYGWDEEYVGEVLSRRFGNSERFVEDIRKLLDEVQKEIGAPRVYYAILKMDGDNMGKVISGKKGMREVKAYLEARGNGVGDFKKPVTPPVHQAITRSLSKFAVEKVSRTVKSGRGEVILAGGDDVLALLPTDRAVETAFRLQKEFRTDWDGFDYLQGRTRSMSAGILVVHYKEPLYYAYQLVSGLEHLAKESGRNALAIGYLAHSGTYHTVVINWEALEGDPVWKLLSLLGEGKEKLSTKFLYEVMMDIERWPDRPEAVLELFKFELSRHSTMDRESVDGVLRMFLELAGHIRPTSVPGETGEKLVDAIIVDPEKGPGDRKLPGDLIDAAGRRGLDEATVAMVMKEQLRGALLLLKILREMGVGS